MRLVVFPRRIVLYLTLGVAFLYLATLTSRFLGMVGLQDGSILGELIEPFDMSNNDASLAAWYSSLLFMLCSILLAVIAALSWQNPAERYTLHWVGLSGIFLLMSADEIARLHEAVGGTAERVLVEYTGFAPEGILYFFWVVPAAVIVLVVGLAYIRFLVHLPMETLALFVAAGTIFVGGAIGLEMVQASLTSNSAELAQNVEPEHGASWWVVRLSLEELFEFVGTLVFCYALFSYLGSHAARMIVEVSDGAADHREVLGDGQEDQQSERSSPWPQQQRRSEP